MSQQIVFADLNAALNGKEIPDPIRETLSLVTIPYVSFENEDRQGQLLVHSQLAKEVEEIFQELYTIAFPVCSILPIAAFNWDDDASMDANNTSAFNYRMKTGKTELSNHSYGTAIDINPMQNPFISISGNHIPKGSSYNPTNMGTITAEGEVVQLFKKNGWRWGGDWKDPIDYQHFEKEISI